MSAWYYKKSNQEFGPVNSPDLKRLSMSGELLQYEKVRLDDTDK